MCGSGGGRGVAVPGICSWPKEGVFGLRLLEYGLAVYHGGGLTSLLGGAVGERRLMKPFETFRDLLWEGK